MGKNRNSDSAAKNAFEKLIEALGYTIEDVGDVSADIAAQIENCKVYFEIKMTKEDRQKGVIFGAATLTEWTAAMANPRRYFFVLAIEKESEGYDFYVISPKDFMKYTYIPPFKVDFNIPYKKKSEGDIEFGEPGRQAGSYVISKKDNICKLQKVWNYLDSLALKSRKPRKGFTNDFVRITNDDNLNEIISKL